MFISTPRGLVAMALAVGMLAAGPTACGNSDDNASERLEQETVAETGPEQADRDRSDEEAAPEQEESRSRDANGPDADRHDPGGDVQAQAAARRQVRATLRRFYEGYLKGDTKAICESVAAGAGDQICQGDSSGFLEAIRKSGAVDRVVREARVVNVRVRSRRASARVRTGGRTRKVALVKGRRGWRIVSSSGGDANAGADAQQALPLGKVPGGGELPQR